MYRPQLLVLTGLPSLRPGLVHFASQMCHNVGAVICGQVILVSRLCDAGFFYLLRPGYTLGQV